MDVQLLKGGQPGELRQERVVGRTVLSRKTEFDQIAALQKGRIIVYREAGVPVGPGEKSEGPQLRSQSGDPRRGPLSGRGPQRDRIELGQFFEDIDPGVGKMAGAEGDRLQPAQVTQRSQRPLLVILSDSKMNRREVWSVLADPLEAT